MTSRTPSYSETSLKPGTKRRQAGGRDSGRRSVGAAVSEAAKDSKRYKLLTISLQAEDTQEKPSK